MRDFLVLKLVIVFLFFSFYSFSQNNSSGPPKPPVGKRWVMNPDFSDEFNGTQLDATKWLDNHPTWKGREPGLFMSSQVSVKDGYLQIKGEKMEKDTIIHAYNRDLTFNIKGGAVVSKKAVFLGYYETRMKASATTMSATFWFSSGGSNVGPNECDKYGLEWDIQECIGRTGGFKGDYFAKGMHSNAHFWYTDCEKKRHDHRASQVRFEEEELASESFHTYGGWWRDESSASYYYDNRAPKHQSFYDEVKKKPFDKPMYMRLVCETYPFPWIELPNEKELSDPSKNTVYYDWVRGYELVDVLDEKVNQEYEVGVKLYDESVIFSEIEMELAMLKANEIKIPISFKANEKRVLYLKISEKINKSKEKKNIKVAETTITISPGYGNLEALVKLKKKLSSNITYKVEASLLPINGTNKAKDALDKSILFFTLKK
ncbi:family 16 glycosylhydrolase [Polaribacter sp. Q13]|uniref:family 16 glycosylhydrolase n=1 Tax=Polaribacter sp. Q13 TaxID=2806551 RepID=UPI00193BB928|nr:family 16 glycosylhydrolase [Polaribacter sp. Q13]QVY66576.1 family 16 glycosylhydrolase [Polaribacter sp. Q13]